MALARAAMRTGDAVEIENYYQHAEHYYRLSKEPPESGRPPLSGDGLACSSYRVVANDPLDGPWPRT